MGQIKKGLGVVLLGGLLTGAGSLVAQQHEEHHPAPPPPAAGEHKMDMAACPHMQVGGLADKLMASFADIQKEQDMTVLKQKLAAHGEALKELKAVTEQKCPMMEMMENGMMGGGKMGSGGMGNMPGMQHPAPSK